MIEDTTSVANKLTTFTIGAARQVTHHPTSWRLARRNGELILQAGSRWTQGSEGGFEWNDVPTVDLDAPENTNDWPIPRRPKPPSLKELALKALQFVDEKLDLPLHNHCNAIHTIRRALEALDD